jgi:hypothetical protein
VFYLECAVVCAACWWLGSKWGSTKPKSAERYKVIAAFVAVMIAHTLFVVSR